MEKMSLLNRKAWGYHGKETGTDTFFSFLDTKIISCSIKELLCVCVCVLLEFPGRCAFFSHIKINSDVIWTKSIFLFPLSLLTKHQQVKKQNLQAWGNGIYRFNGNSKSWAPTSYNYNLILCVEEWSACCLKNWSLFQHFWTFCILDWTPTCSTQCLPTETNVIQIRTMRSATISL